MKESSGGDYQAAEGAGVAWIVVHLLLLYILLGWGIDNPYILYYADQQPTGNGRRDVKTRHVAGCKRKITFGRT